MFVLTRSCERTAKQQRLCNFRANHTIGREQREELRMPAKRAIVLYDGHCVFCCKSIDLLRRLDLFGRLEYRNVRDRMDLPAEISVSPERLLEEMHLLTPDTRRIYHGFAAFRWLAWRLPVLWPIAPLLYFPGVPTLGQRIYLWVARNRFRLIPCHGGVCALSPRTITADGRSADGSIHSTPHAPGPR